MGVARRKDGDAVGVGLAAKGGSTVGVGTTRRKDGGAAGAGVVVESSGGVDGSGRSGKKGFFLKKIEIGRPNLDSSMHP